MPIKPENKGRYPQNWKQIRADILERAENRCEFCGIKNHTTRENGSRVVLTIAHLDHTPENCDYNNLRALCQKCHNKYDAPHRAITRKRTQEAKQGETTTPESKMIADEYDAVISGLRGVIETLQQRVNAAERHCEYLEGKRQESDMQRDYYRDLVEKRWAEVESLSREVAKHVLDTIINTPAKKQTGSFYHNLYARFVEGKPEVRRSTT